MSTADIHGWAEARFGRDGWECEDDIANEVLAQLDMLDINLVTRDDVPYLLAMLEAPAGEAVRESEHFARRLSPIDVDRRRKALASDPTYALFCRS